MDPKFQVGDIIRDTTELTKQYIAFEVLEVDAERGYLLQAAPGVEMTAEAVDIELFWPMWFPFEPYVHTDFEVVESE